MTVVKGYLRTILILTFFFMLVGCATFRYVGTKNVEDSRKRVDSKPLSLVRYHPFKIKKIPTAEDPHIVLLLIKDIRVMAEYQVETHLERKFSRRVTDVQRDWEHEVERDNIFGQFVILATFPLRLLASTIRWETKYEIIKDSNTLEPYYEEEIETVSAEAETIIWRGRNVNETNSEGEVRFSYSLEDFDKSICFLHEETSRMFLVERIQHHRKYKESWYETAKNIKNLFSISSVIITVVKIASSSVVQPGVIVAFLVEQATGVVVGMVIDKVGIKTAVYYTWNIKEIPKNDNVNLNRCNR